MECLVRESEMGKVKNTQRQDVKERTGLVTPSYCRGVATWVAPPTAASNNTPTEANQVTYRGFNPRSTLMRTVSAGCVKPI